MSKLKNAFQNGKAFVPFITCGDPSLDISEQLVYTMEKAGADCIELGIPFSDPTAEGPVIMEASERALKNGTTTDKIFEMVKNIRKNSNIPLVFMTYANVVYRYGIEKFVSKMNELEVDGLILPDVPFEEKKEFKIVCDQYNVDLISMVAPTSNERIKMIAKEAKGYLYIVSSLGVTGTRSKITTDIQSMVNLVREVSNVPCAVGFGISTPDTAIKMAKQSDGCIVGSAIVKLCAKYGKDCIPYVYDFVKEMKDSIKNIG